MLTDLQFALHRFSGYAREVLEPAIYGARHALHVAAFQCAHPIPCADAMRESYEPVDIGWRWGPAWTTAWFHVTGAVPPSMAGHTVALRFSSGTEATLWEDGVPRRGFDANHDSLLLHPRDVLYYATNDDVGDGTGKSSVFKSDNAGGKFTEMLDITLVSEVAAQLDERIIGRTPAGVDQGEVRERDVDTGKRIVV